MLSPDVVTPGWAGVIITALAAAGANIVSGLAIFWKIALGQGVAKTREEQHNRDIEAIKTSLKLIENGESKCKLAFIERISKLEQKSESIQAELAEEKACTVKK